MSLCFPCCLYSTIQHILFFALPLLGPINTTPAPTLPCLYNKRMACKRRGRKKGARKKVIRKNGKRYYRAGKSGLVRLKGSKLPPRRR